MIANAAFLAGVTVFLLAAWLAGELVFLAPYKATLFRQHGWFMGGVALVAVLQPVRPLLQRGAVAVPSGLRPQTPAPRPPTGYVRRRPRRPRASSGCVKECSYASRHRSA